MNWYYAHGGQQQGPVDDAQLDALIAAGTITPESLVWREGMPTWQPLRVARPGGASAAVGGLPPVIAAAPAPAATGPAAGQVQCAECGQYFARENTIQYGTTFVCATCKPVFVQKLREGAAPGGAPIGQVGPFDPESFLAALRERDYTVEIGSCVSRGWDLVKSHFWLTVGAFFVTYLCLIGASLLPCVGFVAQLVVQGPLMGGLYYVFLKLIRSEEAGMGDAFSGFSKAFLQLFLVGLISGILTSLCLAPALGTFIATTQFQANVSPILIGVLFFIGMVPAIYLTICWIFSMQLVMDKEINFWAAMELSRKVVNMHWGMVFLLLVVCGLVAALGLLAVCLGFLVSAPVALAAIMYAYEDIFGTTRPQAV